MLSFHVKLGFRYASTSFYTTPQAFKPDRVCFSMEYDEKLHMLQMLLCKNYATAFEAPLRDSLGNIVASVLGWTVTVDIMDGDSANPKILRERIGTTIFDFGEENEIVASGITSYYDGEKRIKLGLTHFNPVTGGTGKYKGVEGEYSVTRQADSTYVYIFNLKMED